MPPEELGQFVYAKLEEIGPCIVVTLDANTMDASVRGEWAELNLRDYKTSGFSEPALATIAANSPLRGTSSTGITYSTDDGLATGVQWTTLNHSKTFATALQTFFSVVRWFYFCKSDDGLVLISTSKGDQYALDIVASLRRHMLLHGFTLTAQVSRRPFGAEFLSLRLHPHLRTVLLVPKLGRMMSKLFWSAHPADVIDHYSYAYTVAVGMRYLIPVPIVGAMIKRVLELSIGALYDPRVEQRRWEHLRYKSPPGYDRHTLLFQYCQLYDTTVTEIEALELKFAQVTSLPWLVHHPLMDKIICVDLGLTHNPMDLLREEKVKIDPHELPQPPIHLREGPHWTPTSVLAAVVVEELAFTIFPPLRVAVGVVEAIVHQTGLPLVTHLAFALCSWVHPVVAIVAHGFYNLCVL
jgi:hypothetical protein